MYDPLELSRRTLETVFAPTELHTVPERQLEAVADPDTREVLRTLGLPVGKNSVGSMDGEIGERFNRVGEYFDWRLEGTYSNVPSGADLWIPLGMILWDNIALDSDTGKVYGLPEDNELYVCNSTFRHFVHFMYIIHAERPYYDWEWEGGDELFDPEAARARAGEAMRTIDPAAMEVPHSCWHDVLTFMVDPEYDY